MINHEEIYRNEIRAYNECHAQFNQLSKDVVSAYHMKQNHSDLLSQFDASYKECLQHLNKAKKHSYSFLVKSDIETAIEKLHKDRHQITRVLANHDDQPNC